MKSEWRLFLRDRANLVSWFGLAATVYLAVQSGLERTEQRKLAQTTSFAAALEREAQADQAWKAIAAGEKPAGRDPRRPSMARWFTSPVVAWGSHAWSWLAASDDWMRPAFSANLLDSPAFDPVEMRSPIARMSGRFDLGFVVAFLLPLFVLILAGPGLGSDRDQGVTPLLRMRGSGLWATLMRRMFVRIAAILLALSVPTTFALAWSPRSESLALDNALPVLAIAVAFLVFWLLFTDWTELASSSRASRWAKWILGYGLFAIVVPSAADTAASALHPEPSRVADIVESRRLTDNWENPDSRAITAFRSEYPELESVVASTVGDDTAWLVTQESLRAGATRLHERIEGAHARRLAGIATASWGSPCLAIQAALDRASGISQHDWLQVLPAVRSMIRERERILVPAEARKDQLTQAQFSSLPRSTATTFTHTARSWPWLGSLAPLIAAVLLTILLCHRAIRRTAAVAGTSVSPH